VLAHLDGFCHPREAEEPTLRAVGWKDPLGRSVTAAQADAQIRRRISVRGQIICTCRNRACRHDLRPLGLRWNQLIVKISVCERLGCRDVGMHIDGSTYPEYLATSRCHQKRNRHGNYFKHRGASGAANDSSPLVTVDISYVVQALCECLTFVVCAFEVAIEASKILRHWAFSQPGRTRIYFEQERCLRH
jgi:hypothetical protein